MSSQHTRPMSTVSINDLSMLAKVVSEKQVHIMPSGQRVAVDPKVTPMKPHDLKSYGQSVWVPTLSNDKLLQSLEGSIYEAQSYYKTCEKAFESYKIAKAQAKTALQSMRALRNGKLGEYKRLERARKREAMLKARQDALALLGLTPEQLEYLKSR